MVYEVFEVLDLIGCGSTKAVEDYVSCQLFRPIGAAHSALRQNTHVQNLHELKSGIVSNRVGLSFNYRYNQNN